MITINNLIAYQGVNIWFVHEVFGFGVALILFFPFFLLFFGSLLFSCG